MTTARQIIGDLKGVWHGSYGTARCPGHDDRAPSLSVTDGRDGRLLVYCHAGCGQEDVIEALKRLGLWGGRGRKGKSWSEPAPFVRDFDLDAASTRAERTRKAIAVWNGAKAISGTPVMTYLFRRGIDIQQLPCNLRRALRWHGACPWENGRHPCMVALFTDIATNEPRAIHRTAITPAGEKGGRKSLGPIGGCVIRLTPDEEVEHGLGICEGIETGLSVLNAGWAPVWACGSKGGIEKLSGAGRHRVHSPSSPIAMKNGGGTGGGAHMRRAVGRGGKRGNHPGAAQRQRLE